MKTLLVFLVALLPTIVLSGCSDDEDLLIDCSDLKKAGETLSGVYSIYPTKGASVWVYCQMISGGKSEDNGGWTVFQRRMDGSVNFYRPWKEYKRGFGTVEGEYWLGLENLYQLTRNRKYMLRVDLEDFEGKKVFALYSSFSVGCESDGYKLQVSGFTDGGAGDSLTSHNGFKFSTFDKDQDTWDNNCAKSFLGAYWYGSCHNSNLNGVYLWGEDATLYAIGNVWYPWKNSYAVGLKSTTMKIKPVS